MKLQLAITMMILLMTKTFPQKIHHHINAEHLLSITNPEMMMSQIIQLYIIMMTRIQIVKYLAQLMDKVGLVVWGVPQPFQPIRSRRYILPMGTIH